MFTLFVESGCAFCARVLDTIDELGITVERKNIADPAVEAELIAHGGKRQVPYLIDSSRGVAMYESDDIVEYLREHYSAQHPTETEGAGVSSAPETL